MFFCAVSQFKSVKLLRIRIKAGNFPEKCGRMKKAAKGFVSHALLGVLLKHCYILCEGVVFMEKRPRKKSFLGIREIAQIAGVSTATVSRVINHPEQCTEKTRRMVEQVIKKYKYVPNETIKQIFSKSSHTIAVFIQDINNPFYTHLIMELNNICFRERYTLLICDTENDIEKERAYLELCLAKRCVGIILTEGVSHELFNDIEIPIVALDRKDTSSQVSLVTSENYYIMNKVVSYLCNLGHRRIAFIAPRYALETVENRFRGFLDFLKAKDLPVIPEYIYREGSALDVSLGKRALQYFLSLEEMPTAVICANDMIALGVINEALLLHISIPGTLSVCGFDHILDDYLFMPLTTVEQDIPQLALKLFQSILNPPARPAHTIVDCKFIQGKTCARASRK